ncbi:MAG: hypothetical protein JKY52_13135 [Flavobacteriales bacterium]|nr:hypothetical protein [Flavobacteriales bacterium]
MKKLIYTASFALLLAIGSLSTGCGNAQQETEEHDKSHEHAHYQCPMDCESGKTYEEAGTCPVCKMDLAEIEKS